MVKRTQEGGYEILGEVALVKGDYDLAKTYFQQSVELNPNSQKAYYGLAVTYEKQGKYSQAISALKKSLEIEPHYVSALRRLGVVQIKAGQYKDALKTGREMKTLGVKGSYAILGNAALHLGNTKQAIGFLTKAPEENIATDYLLGLCFMVEGKYRKALEYMEGAFEKNNGDFGAFVSRLMLRFYLDQETELEEKFSGQLNKKSVRLLDYVKGSINASKGRWADAKQCWESAEGLIRGFSLKGIDEETLSKCLKKDELKYINIGALLYLEHLYSSSLSVFEKAININKDSIFANYWASQIYLKKGDRTKALKHIENATIKAPDFFPALCLVGELNRMNGRQDIARRNFLLALAVEDNAGIRIKLGMIFENSGDFKKAEKQYGQAIELSPDIPVGYNQLAWLYADKGVNLDKALDLAQKADKLQPGNASILDTIGWIYYRKKEYDKAIAHFLKPIEANPNNPTILYHLGVTYSEKGDSEAAKETLQKALKISAKFKEADKTHELLKKLD